MLEALVSGLITAGFDALRRGENRVITCPRCLGSGQVNWDNICALGMECYWDPGPCRYCAQQGKISVERLREKDVRSIDP